jgi:hypothetical protein
MQGFSSISSYELFLGMVFAYDDAQRSNSHKEKLFSLLVVILLFFFSSYLQVGVTRLKGKCALGPFLSILVI